MNNPVEEGRFIPETLTKERLLTAETIASLVAKGRAPGIIGYGGYTMVEDESAIFGERAEPDGETFVCVVPPKGTQLGDSRNLRFFGVEFYSPKGELRGVAQEFTLTSEEAKQVKRLRTAALVELNTPAPKS